MSAREMEEVENPQAGKGDVSLARLGMNSLQPMKQFMHLKAVVSPPSLTCAASLLSRHTDGISSTVGSQWKGKGNIWPGLSCLPTK